ncbi:MAG: type VI secretion system baseplate subunit TssK [Maricaulaceae bacterium]
MAGGFEGALPGPILWRQGLALTPQLFQHQDAATYQHVARRAALGQAYPWGAARIDWRPERTQPVAALEAVTADGVLLRAGDAFAGSANAVLRTIAPSEAALREGGDVYALLARAPQGADPWERDQTPAPHPLASARFVARSQERGDCYDPDSPERTRVTSLDFLVQILIIGPGDPYRWDSLRHDFDGLRLGAVVAQKDGFEPDGLKSGARLDVLSEPALVDRLKRWREAVTRKASDFVDHRRDRGLALSVGAGQDVSVFMISQVLHAVCADATQALDADRLHPFDAYGLMRRHVGALAALSSDHGPLGDRPARDGDDARPGLPVYDHADPGPGFARAFDRAHALLDQLSLGPTAAVELVYRENGMWSADIPGDFIGGRLPKYFLVVDSTIAREQVRDALHERKLGPASELEDIIDRRLLGLDMRLLDYAPEQLPQRTNRYTYFEIDQTSFYWPIITRELNIKLYCPELDHDNTRVRLVKTETEA